MITNLIVARKASLLATLLLSLACLTEPAGATNALNDPPHRNVELSDLDLDQPLHIEKLHRRISKAAREVCRTHGVVATLHRGRMRECTRDTVAYAVKALNVPALTAHHQRTLPTNVTSSLSCPCLD